MRKSVFILSAAFALAASYAIVGCSDNKDPKATGTTAGISPDSMVKRGEYLVAIMGCEDCHSPKTMGPHGPEIDMTKRLSGHPAQMPLGPVNAEALKTWVLFNNMETATIGPWGASFSANITSSSSGIGDWTEERFLKCIREGKSKGLEGARTMLPPMPWQEVSHATDEDLKAIFAFLKSTKPVDNIVPQAIPPDQIAKLAK